MRQNAYYPHLYNGSLLNHGGQVWVSIDRGVAWVHSDFYNGAASTSQCQRLTAAIQEVGQLDTVKVVLLMGGEHSYGNGINLNTIEASADPDIVRGKPVPCPWTSTAAMYCKLIYRAYTSCITRDQSK